MVNELLLFESNLKLTCCISLGFNLFKLHNKNNYISVSLKGEYEIKNGMQKVSNKGGNTSLTRGSLYMYIEKKLNKNLKFLKKKLLNNLNKTYNRIIFFFKIDHIQTNSEIQMMSSIRLNHVNVNQVIIFTAIWLCNA